MKSFLETAFGKVIIALIAVGVAGSGIAAVIVATKSDSKEPPTVAVAVEEITTIEETNPETTVPTTEPEITTETTTEPIAMTTAKPTAQSPPSAKATTTTKKPTTAAVATEKATTTITATATTVQGGLDGNNKEFFDMFRGHITSFKDPASLKIIEIHNVTTAGYNLGKPFYVVHTIANNSYGGATQAHYYVTQISMINQDDVNVVSRAATMSYVKDSGKTHHTYDMKAINAAVQAYVEEKGY